MSTECLPGTSHRDYCQPFACNAIVQDIAKMQPDIIILVDAGWDSAVSKVIGEVSRQGDEWEGSPPIHGERGMRSRK